MTTEIKRQMDGRCARRGCDAIATCVPKLLVPAQGHAIDTHQPIACLIDLRMCAEHFNTFSLTDALNHDLRDTIRIIARGRAPPDFARAIVSRVDLNSEEYVKYLKDKA